MKAVSKILAGGAVLAALVTAAPAAAQYPGYGGYGGYGTYGYGNSGGVVGSILDSILGGQRYGQNDRYAVDICVRATEARLNGYQGAYGYNYGTYGGYGTQGYSQGYNGARVTRVTNVERRPSGSLKVYGFATTGYGRSGYGAYGGYNQGYGGYGNQGYGGYGNQGYGGYGSQGYGEQLRFNCKVNSRGMVTDVDIDRRRY